MGGSACQRRSDRISADSRGPIRNYDFEGIFYFDNKIVSFEVTGAELLELLRISVAKVHAGHGRFLQVSGIRFRYRVGGTEDEPVYSVEAADVQVAPRGSTGYRALELDRRYSAASLDYVWENGYRDGYALFSKGAGQRARRRRTPASPVATTTEGGSSPPRPEGTRRRSGSSASGLAARRACNMVRMAPKAAPRREASTIS